MLNNSHKKIFLFETVVQEILAIAGGFSDSTALTSWSIVMAGGRECLQHDLPDFPSKQEGFGLAQAYDRYIFKCGGRTGTTDCKQIFGG